MIDNCMFMLVIGLYGCIKNSFCTLVLVLQFKRHGDVLSEGVGAGGQPEPHAAEADGRARLHHGPPDGLPRNPRQHGGRAMPEDIRYSRTSPPKPY